MAFRIRVRRKPKVGQIVGGFATLFLSLWVGGDILNAVISSMTGVSNPFLSEGFLDMFGINHTSGTINGNFLTSSILGIVGIISGASIVLGFVRINF